MIKIIKFFPTLLFFLIVAILCLLRWYFAYQQFFSLNDTNLVQKYEQIFWRASATTIQLDGHKVHYLDLGDPDDQMVMWIHGAPWSIGDSSWLLSIPEMQKWYRFIIPDRLWYGKSEPWRSQESIKKHADISLKLLEYVGIDEEKPPLIVGHSYGATIAAKILMDYSDKVAWGIIVSWALDPDHEIVFPISHIVKYQPLKFLMWPMLWVANDEKLSHVDSLTNEVQNFADITKPFVVLHGTEDSIVPYANVAYMKERVPEDVFTLISLPWENHPLQMQNPQAIADTIQEFQFETRN